MLEQFSKVKEDLLDFATKLRKYECIDKAVIENSRLNEEVNNLKREEFKIALVAPFSAGKSTFINSLIGNDLLSMDITAETSVITKIKNSQDIKIKIKYRKDDMIKEITKDEKGRVLDDSIIKEVLQKISTVKGENTEDNIKEVIVYYPIELCKDNVELIDTPGLFARHEKHENITNSILPQINAVIFMIDPSSVGEEHFTKVIQNYVNNAKHSKLEEKGKHIFFVINKIDDFQKEDVDKAEKELRIVLEDLLEEPQIFRTSAYYAMLGKMYANGKLSLERLQKDRKIRIQDPEDPEYTLSGKLINKNNAGSIIIESNIKYVENEIEKYLENKNMYLISDIKRTISDIIKNSLEKLNSEKVNIEYKYKEDKDQYTKQLNTLEEAINRLKGEHTEEIRYEISNNMLGNSSGGGEINKIKVKIDGEFQKLEWKICNELDKNWKSNRNIITRDNAEGTIIDLVNDIEEELEVQSKKNLKGSFCCVKGSIEKLGRYTQDKLNQMKFDLEHTEKDILGREIGNITNYDLENILDDISNMMDRQFSTLIMKMSQGLSEEIGSAISSSNRMVERSGIFYRIFKFFTGREKYDEEFDKHEFLSKCDVILNEINKEISSKIIECSLDVQNNVIDAINEIVNKFIGNIEKIIQDSIQIKLNLISNVKETMEKSEDETKRILKEKDEYITCNQYVLSEFEKIIREIED